MELVVKGEGVEVELIVEGEGRGRVVVGGEEEQL